MLGSAAYLTVLAVLSVAVGALIRTTAGGVTAVLGILLVLPVLARILPSSTADTVARYLPGNAGQAIFGLHQSSSMLTPWAGFTVLCLYAGVALPGAAVMLRATGRVMAATPPTAGEPDAGGDRLAPVRSAALRLRRLAARLPPTVGDATLAAVLFVVVLGRAVRKAPGECSSRRPAAAPGVAATGADHGLRRRHRVAFVQWLIDVQLPADVALLVALYTVAAHSDWRAAAAGVVMEAAS